MKTIFCQLNCPRYVWSLTEESTVVANDGITGNEERLIVGDTCQDLFQSDKKWGSCLLHKLAVVCGHINIQLTNDSFIPPQLQLQGYYCNNIIVLIILYYCSYFIRHYGRLSFKNVTYEIIFIRWTFNFVYFVGRAIHKFKILTKYSFTLVLFSIIWNHRIQLSTNMSIINKPQNFEPIK